MFPWVYEFNWTPYHLIFLGVFFSVIAIIGTTLLVTVLRVRKDFTGQKAEHIQWKSAFEELPTAARTCRHELTREIAHRTCSHEFDCGTCTAHPAFLAKYNPEKPPSPPEEICGLQFATDRMYHRGHSWIQKQEDGAFLIGLDDFGARLIGTPDTVDLPEVGARLKANGTGWHMKKMNVTLRVLSPIDGEVLERGGVEKGWFLKVCAENPDQGTSHLLRGAEIRPWILRELDRLQFAITTDGVGACLADGGELVPEVWKQYPQLDWAGVWGEMLLEA